MFICVNKYRNLLYIMFHALFALNIIRQVCPKIFGTVGSESILVCQILFIILTIIVIFISKENILNQVKQVFKCKWIIIGVAIYVLIDLFNCLYAEEKMYAFSKYIFICRSGLTAITILLYAAFIDRNLPVKKIIVNIGITSLIISLMSYFLYYNLSNYTVIDKRIAMSASYNEFAVTILMGFIGITVLLLINECSFIKKVVFIGLVSIIEIPAIYLSSSKRGILLLIIYILCVTIFIFIKWIIFVVKENNLKDGIKKFLVCLCSIIIVYLCVIGHCYFFNNFNEVHIKEGKGLSTKERLSESNLVEDGAREGLWTVAINGISDFSKLEFFIGKGASYSSDLYDDLEGENAKIIYSLWDKSLKSNNWLDPHNIILNDFLEGGLIKVLSFFFVVVIIMYYLIHYKISNAISIILLSYFAIIFAGLLISAHYGALYNRWTVIVLTLMIIAVSYSHEGVINDESICCFKRKRKKISR